MELNSLYILLYVDEQDNEEFNQISAQSDSLYFQRHLNWNCAEHKTTVDKIQQDLLCSPKRLVNTFQKHLKIIWFFYSMKQAMNQQIRSGVSRKAHQSLKIQVTY